MYNLLINSLAYIIVDEILRDDILVYVPSAQIQIPLKLSRQWTFAPS
jgi:hypothetical protein